ncbi:UNVERIFIED_CONTAM: hypothetical protein Slati_1499200 [Sesamum latifolium]|uniref:RNase H type-1 domain-containing protein n=1 Tax=Sesamum latifolium TaxID=2727402 RepID=A0AAW2X6C2_9LAMI
MNFILFTKNLETVVTTSSFLLAFREANATKLRQQKQNRLGISKRSIPPVGTTKINFDGAALQKGHEAGIGGVARDSNGLILAWFSYELQRTVDGETAEALTARETADLAKKFGWNNVRIEGDCVNLINKLKSPDMDYSASEPLVQVTKLALASTFVIPFSHVSRDLNNIAHKLATRARAQLFGSGCFSPAEADLFGLLEVDFDC